MKYLTTLAQVLTPDDITNVPQVTPTDSAVNDGLQIFFGIAAAVAMLIITISALRITLSRGNSADVQKGRDAIIYASIGLVITMSGFVIVTFVLDRV